MKTQTRLFLTAVFCFILFCSYAQEHVFFEQTGNLIHVNPAFTGSEIHTDLLVDYFRKGISKNQKYNTLYMSYHGNVFSPYFGIGGYVHSDFDKPGDQEKYSAGALLSYAFPTPFAFVGIGIKASFNNSCMDWGNISDRYALAKSPADININPGKNNYGDIGAGILA